MPTVLRVGSMRFVVYPNDHPPAHIHVVGPGWIVVVDLVGLAVREAVGCDRRIAGRVLRHVEAHQPQLLEAWRRYHE